MYVIAVIRKWNLKIVSMSNLGILLLIIKSTVFPVSKTKRIGKQSTHLSNGLQSIPFFYQRHNLLTCYYLALIMCSSCSLSCAHLEFFSGKKASSSLPQENTLIPENNIFRKLRILRESESLNLR